MKLYSIFCFSVVFSRTKFGFQKLLFLFDRIELIAHLHHPLTQMPREHSSNSTDDAYIVMRLTSHFLEFVAPTLESFKEKHQKTFEGRGGESVKDEEYDFSMTALYSKFCDIFEGGMEVRRTMTRKMSNGGRLTSLPPPPLSPSFPQDYLESGAGVPKNHLWRIMKKVRRSFLVIN